MRLPYTHDSEVPPVGGAQMWRYDSASDKQKTFLTAWGVWKEGLSKGVACDLISQIKRKTEGMEWKDIRLQQELIQQGKAKPPIPVDGFGPANPLV